MAKYCSDNARALRVMSIFGTRPEAIKMAPLIKELENTNGIQSIVCVSAQHREMLDQVLDIFGISPGIDLDIMKKGQTLTGITTAVLSGLCDIFTEYSPDLCLVHGDTTTTFSASLAAFYAGIKVGHVEAGLRTYDKRQPYPEEMNRVLTSRLADMHFAPTHGAKENLLKENISESDIFTTGNTVIDALKYTAKHDYTFACEELNKLDYKASRVVTLTAHRRENLGEGLEGICKAVLKVADKYQDARIVYPVHLNPSVSEPVRALLGGHRSVLLTPPLSITDMHNLMLRSYMILTDSGGLQEEAPSMDKPVIVLRNVTERPEGLKAGTLILAGTDKDRIVNCVSSLFDDKSVYDKMASAKNPFGDGHASKRIADAILYYFGRRNIRPECFK